jgi:glycosyltransferase involved in cell wall biosynthesis
MIVNQFHSGTALGDAVTQNMLELREELRSLGYRSDIYAEHVAAGLEADIQPIGSYRGSRDHVLLVHHSMGHDAFDRVVALPDRIVTVFHNITPEQYFTDAMVRAYVRLGRQQLRRLASRSVAGIAVSNYNRREMLEAGFRRVIVLPVRTRFDRFEKQRGSFGNRTRDWLFVGRVVGNKAQHDIVRSFAAFARAYDDEAVLHLVGSTDDGDYTAFVRSEAERLGVADRVRLAGKVPHEDLAGIYGRCGLFVSLSEHEGFGVPLLEAMAAGLPVLAHASAAVPETLAGAGVLLRARDPWTVAATAKVILDDSELRERLVTRQDRRLAQLREFDVPATLRRVVERASGADDPLTVQIQGPFETSYSLAVLNRRLAEELDRLGESVSIFATEGPGDYVPRAEDVSAHPHASALHGRARAVPYPDIVIRQMYPPRVHDAPGGLNFQYFGWEESRLPADYVDDFNRYLDGIGVMSSFVEQVLRDSGVTVPIAVVGVGVDPHPAGSPPDLPELRDLRMVRFLHISSAFPRKGVDVLLGAFFDQFTGDDDVSLVLKTFPNPHNTVAELLQALRADHPNPPDVRWIDEDLTSEEARGLFGIASCYVHAARGEGFGLPVTEAMLADVPVIAVAATGLADFCDDTTVATVPFRVEPACTHLTVPGSMWVEPDRQALGAELRRFAEAPDAEDVRQRVRNARKRVEEQYSWATVAKRWRSFIDDLERTQREPRVALVTTWNARCGIAENARYLAAHATPGTYEVFADTKNEILDPAADDGVVRCWHDRWTPDLTTLTQALARSDADAVHVQFNFGFFELERLAALLDHERARRPVVLTLHATEDLVIDGQPVSLASIAATLRRLDRIIVHQPADAAVLERFGVLDNVDVIPLGAPPARTATDRRPARAARLRQPAGDRYVRLPPAPQGHTRADRGHRPPP